ncbi:hypothetical protein WMY93_026500 [Mugilogobius chulae]|uniref:Mitochondrial import receptor subunit TOM40 homolog n=1 Tax=Mugilogobius chulae TaxID=88201 RepID=A0AAW0N133_9GOBI
MVMSKNGEQHFLAAAPLDLRTTHRERGSSGTASPDSRVTGGSPAPPACTETDSLDQRKAQDSCGARDNRKRREFTAGNSGERVGSCRGTGQCTHTTLLASLTCFCSILLPVPEPVGPVHHQTGHLLSPIVQATRQDEDGDTPLHIAVVQGKMAVVYKLLQIFLLEHRSPDIYNNLRQTPLHLAIITQQANMVEALLKAGADPTALDRNGLTALHLCCEYDQGDCLSLLLSLRSIATCLEIRNYEGMTPLHLAVLHGHKDLATLLLSTGADINAMDNKSGQSPLMHAVESNNVNMVHFLIENGCDVNSQSYSRNTALHCACGRGQVDTVRLLLKNGADSGLKNYHNDTPVMVTTNKKIADVIRGRSSKQMRVQDHLYLNSSPLHRSVFADSGPPSPNQSHGCSPSSTFSLSHQTNQGLGSGWDLLATITDVSLNFGVSDLQLCESLPGWEVCWLLPLPALHLPLETAEGDSPLPNPGTYEECHRKCKEVFPLQMEGVRLLVNKGLSNYFQVSHTVTLSTVADSGYRFGATYVGSKQTSPTESFPVMVGDMDNTGSLNAQIIHQLTSAVRSKIAIQTQQQKFVNWQIRYFSDHYLQSITPSLALGGELVYHRRPGEEGTVTSFLGRYTGDNYVATLTLGGAGVHATYYHKANDQLQVGVEFEANTRMQETTTSLGYQLDLPKANLLFKGSIDSNWVVGATLEKKLLPLPLTLALGAFLNHRKNKFQCGFGVTIG